MTSTTTDAQTWVYPAPGAATPPVAATSNFGPVHYQDSMVLNWSPNTSPTIAMTCISTQGNYSSYYVTQGSIQPPFTYKFSNQVNLTSSTDESFCHFYFLPSTMGNSVVFQFENSAQAKAVTWGAAAVSTSSSLASTSSTSASTLATSSSSAKVTSSATASSSASPDSSATLVAANSNSGGGLSTGASAGIGIGVALAAIVLVAIGGLLLFRRRKAARNNQAVHQGYVSEIDSAPAAMPYHDKTQHLYEKEVPPAELG